MSCKMNAVSSNSECSPASPLVAQIDDIQNFSSDAEEECLLHFLDQVEGMGTQRATAEANAALLLSELDEAIEFIDNLKAKCAHMTKLVDQNRSERNIILKKFNELGELLEGACDLLSNDIGSKLKDETPYDDSFVNGTARLDVNANLSGITEPNSNGASQCELSCVLSEESTPRGAASSSATEEDGEPKVPPLLVQCVSEVERRGLAEGRLYRGPSEELHVQRLKESFLNGSGSPDLTKEDVHVICGCIIDFLRSFPWPIVTGRLWSVFELASKKNEPNYVIRALYHMPLRSRDTLAFLMLHLQKLAGSPECDLGVEELAKIFGPLMFGYWRMARPTTVNNVMQLLLQIPSYYWIQGSC